MKQGKEGALIVGERDVLSIYIRAGERDARITPPLFPASLIIQTLCVMLGDSDNLKICNFELTKIKIKNIRST
jgi:hypothetical protein